MNVPTKLRPSLLLILSLSLFVTGCDTRASRAQRALEAYQTASAEGNAIEMRNALLKLTAADEDNPAYWIELGKLQYELRAMAAAYDAFSRANELSRSDPEVLRFLTQIALQSGNLEIADERADELDLVAPGNAMVKVTKGLIALQRQQFEQAQTMADAILATAPADTNGIILKSRALVGLKKADEAIALLERQMVSQPRDTASLRALFTLRRRGQQWPVVAALGQRVLALDPKDRTTGLLTVEAALRAQQPAVAKALSLTLAQPGVGAAEIDKLLDVWTRNWTGPEPVALARALATRARPDERVAFAHYLNRQGAPEAGRALMADQASAAVSPPTIPALAAYAESLFRLGQANEARVRLQAILDEDSDNIDALRTMAEVLLKTGDHRQALNVARKLVAVDPVTPESRFVLARVFEANGDRDSARRSLWDAFHAIPASEPVYRALRAYLGNDSDAARRLDEEYADQRDRKIMQDAQ